ncbi:hypothetical protein L6Q79_14950 [bacterium]|nr:hypothetical protein [bacterium]NUN46888.1 hypothetical protein [bacterium]
MENKIKRWNASVPGRSRMVSHDNIIWVVSTVAKIPDFDKEVEACLYQLEKPLEETGSHKTHILSLQIILSRIESRGVFYNL